MKGLACYLSCDSFVTEHLRVCEGSGMRYCHVHLGKVVIQYEAFEL